MRRGSVFLSVFALVAVVIFAGSASAQSCEDEQLIFRISGTSNAHAEVWNGNVYSEKICFSDFFENDYGGGNPHNSASGGENKVLRLSSESNAHVEAPNESNYETEVFFGDLKCEVVHIMEDCGDLENNGREGTRIVSLSGVTNAHVKRGSPTSPYNYELCCASASVDPLSNASCGDGIVNRNEDCDCGSDGDCSSSELGGYSCNEIDEDTIGSLGCNAPGESNECRFDTSGCIEEVDVPNICNEFALDSDGFHSLTIGGDEVTPNSCADYNKIESSDVPNEYAGSLNDFRREMCQNCYIFIPEHILGSGLPDSSDNPYCYWDEEDDECFLGYEEVGGQQCLREWISDPGCGEGDVSREVEYSDNCEVGCEDGGCTITLQCPRVIQLPFFGGAQFGFSLVIVGLIYLAQFYLLRKK